jgi:hypothetical protein
MPHFGPRIIGDAAFTRAVEAEKGGGTHFGPRVLGVQQQTAIAAHAKPHRAPESSVLGIEELTAMLADNPTHFDSLYLVELAQERGPRPEALTLFKRVEMAGQGRADVLAEIEVLLVEVAQGPRPRANEATAPDGEAIEAAVLALAEREARATEREARIEATIAALGERAAEGGVDPVAATAQATAQATATTLRAMYPVIEKGSAAGVREALALVNATAAGDATKAEMLGMLRVAIGLTE